MEQVSGMLINKIFKVSNNEKSQTLVLVIFIITIFSATITAISSLSVREIEMLEVGEMALNAEYAAETGQERAREILSRGYAVRFDGVDDYINVGQEKVPLFDNEASTGEQFTIEGWFKIDNLDFSGFKPLIIRGIPNEQCGGYNNAEGRPYKGCVEGSIAIAGKSVSTPAGAPFSYCPKRLHFSVFTSNLLGQNIYYWFPISDNHECQGAPEILPNKWYHLILSYVDSRLVLVSSTYYLYINGPDFEKNYHYPTVPNNAGIQGGSYNIRIATTMKKDAYFPGVIDEIRIYKHPCYCGNPATFWPNVEPGQPTDPNDPLNHFFGIYGYQDNIPPCAGWICGDVCNNWSQYYPPDYNMETHDLIFYYDFDAQSSCYTNPTVGCIKDKSPSADDNGTPFGFSQNGQEIPAAPNSKNPVYVDVTEYGKIYSLNKDSEQGDLNSM